MTTEKADIVSPLFQYVSRNGETRREDTYPHEGVIELILLRDADRFLKDGIRPHLSHPLHEAAMTALPIDLVVLRMSGTKVRTFPQIPPSMEELYAEYNYFVDIPDLAHATNLHIMNMADGRIERFIGAFPPAIQSINIENNAFKTFHVLPPPTITLRARGNPTPRVVNHNANMPDDRPGRLAPFYLADYLGAQAALHPHQHGGFRPIQEDSQNVHDSGVQASCNKNIQYLMERRKAIPHDPAFLERFRARLTRYKRKEMCLEFFLPTYFHSEDDKINDLRARFNNNYAMHGVHFENFVESVCLRIEAETDTDTQKELFRRFCEEVREGRELCTGECL